MYRRERRRLENQAPASYAVDEEHLASMLASVGGSSSANRLWIKLAIKGLAREGRDVTALAARMPAAARAWPACST
ncbi:MAG: hypothetical protein ACE5JG_11950, partial [Planctomycetota bacterium]